MCTVKYMVASGCCFDSQGHTASQDRNKQSERRSRAQRRLTLVTRAQLEDKQDWLSYQALLCIFIQWQIAGKMDETSLRRSRRCHRPPAVGFAPTDMVRREVEGRSCAEEDMAAFYAVLGNAPQPQGVHPHAAAEDIARSTTTETNNIVKYARPTAVAAANRLRQGQAGQLAAQSASGGLRCRAALDRSQKILRESNFAVAQGSTRRTPHRRGMGTH